MDNDNGIYDHDDYGNHQHKRFHKMAMKKENLRLSY